MVAGEGGFLLREKLTEFKADSVLQKLFSGKRIFRFASADFPPAERGLGNEYGRDSVLIFSAGLIILKSY